jgi:hypothetical protein
LANNTELRGCSPSAFQSALIARLIANQVIEHLIINQMLYQLALQTNGLDASYDGSMAVDLTCNLL